MTDWQPRFSTRRLMLWVAVFAAIVLLPLQCFLSFRDRLTEYRRTAAMFEALGGEVQTSGDGASALNGAAGIVGIMLSDHITSKPIDDGDLERLKDYLATLTGLQRLYLNCKNVTDKGLVHLRCLAQFPKLYTLTLIGSQVTDAGLIHLQALTQLEELYLTDTAVTPAGAKALKKFLTNTRIHLGKIEF